MNLESLPKILGILGSVLMPVFNIPLIYRIVMRKSSDDISLGWVLGVEACVILMLPSALQSAEPVLKIFGITNAISFSIVTIVVLSYHRKP
jgi:hypothetical protein